MDVTDDASVADGVAPRRGALGGLDTLVNSAGVFQFRALEGISTAEWDRILDVNLRGTFLVMREAMPHLKASRRGRVVNISSDAGKTGFPLLGAYCASKFGVVGLTQAVAAEVAPRRRPGQRGLSRQRSPRPAWAGSSSSRRSSSAWRRSPEEVVRRGAASFPLQRVGNVADVVGADPVPDLRKLQLDHRRVDQYRRRLPRRLSAAPDSEGRRRGGRSRRRPSGAGMGAAGRVSRRPAYPR